ncbi:MAG TPA: RNA polymerase sigma-70 factor [Saprospiraceae bacterium]|nr:RNA polymerase sigma-70 factor [Saprospiraceae bacterium]
MRHPSADTTEQSLLSRLRADDEGALRQLFQHHYPLLIGDIYRLIPDEDSCKDLAQEVFVDLWRKRAELDIHTSLRAYLRRAAVNRAINHLKMRQRFLLDDGEQLGNTADSSPHDIAHQEEQETLEQALHAAIQTLPEKCRIVFCLSRFEQLSHREIGEQLGISVKTIENQITKAIKILRDALLRQGHLSPAVIWLLKIWASA